MTAISGQNLIICILRGNHDPGPRVTQPDPFLGRLGFRFWKQAKAFCSWSKMDQILLATGFAFRNKNICALSLFVRCMRWEWLKYEVGSHYRSNRLGSNIEFRMHRQFEPKFAAIALNNKDCPPSNVGATKKGDASFGRCIGKVKLILLNKFPSSIFCSFCAHILTNKSREDVSPATRGEK